MAETEENEQLKSEFGKGTITPAGITNEKGELLPRATLEPRMGLSVEDEFTIDMWNKQIKRDFPHLDDSFIDMISTYCYKHPEESKAYALENANRSPSEKKYKSLPYDKYEPVIV